MIMKQCFLVLHLNYRVVAFELFLQITQPRYTDICGKQWWLTKNEDPNQLIFCHGSTQKPSVRER